MKTLVPVAALVAARLVTRGQTIAIAESSTGGLIAAALLAVPGASAYFLGGAVVYTRGARQALLGITPDAMAGLRASTEPYATLLARTIRARLAADWGLGESGAAGPAGNSYGDPPGHCCIAISGASGDSALTIETGVPDREANMRAFALAALERLLTELA